MIASTLWRTDGFHHLDRDRSISVVAVELLYFERDLIEAEVADIEEKA